MSPIDTVRVIKKDLNQASYKDDLWFRWKTPDEFIYNNKKCKLREEEKKELRQLIGDLIKVYLNSVSCETEE